MFFTVPLPQKRTACCRCHSTDHSIHGISLECQGVPRYMWHIFTMRQCFPTFSISYVALCPRVTLHPAGSHPVTSRGWSLTSDPVKWLCSEQILNHLMQCSHCVRIFTCVLVFIKCLHVIPFPNSIYNCTVERTPALTSPVSTSTSAQWVRHLSE